MKGRDLAPALRSALLAALALTACAPSKEAASGPAPLPVGVTEAEPAIRRDLERRHSAAAETAQRHGEESAPYARRLGDYAISLFANGYFAEASGAFDAARRIEEDRFDWHYYYGLATRRTGDMDAAAGGFTDALAVDGRSLPALLWRAEVRLHRERLDDAENDFRQALEWDPHCGQAMTGLGRIALSRGEYDDAVPLLRRALEHRPDSPPARYALALALRGQGKVAEARAEMDSLQGENHSLIITCFEDPLMREVRRRKTGTRAHEERAVRAREEGLTATALVELQAAVRANPNRYPARFDIAGLLLQLGRREEAVAELETLLDLEPEYSAALVLLARLELESGDTDRSDELIARAVAADPQSETIHLARAEIARSQGRQGEALAAFDRALEIDPALVAAHLGRAATLTVLGDPQGALRSLEEAHRRFPSRQALALARAQLMLLTGAAADAVAIAQSANEPATIAGSHVLAEVLAGAGRHREAAGWQRRALAALPAGPAWEPRRLEMADRLSRYERGFAVPSALDPTLLAHEQLLRPLAAPTGS